MNLKISYTPFLYKNEKDDFTIPEASLLNPIQLSDDVVSEIIKQDDSESIEKSNTNEEKPSVLNLTWARDKISTPIEKRNSYDDIVIDPDKIKYNQMIAESSGNANAISKVGAKGLYQIMDGTYNDYVKATGEKGDLFNPEFNTKVRDWYMDWLGKNKIVNTNGVSDFIKTARQLVAYNWGIGNLKKLLNKHQASGTDINNSLDWLEGIPEETRNYVNKILLKNYSV